MIEQILKTLVGLATVFDPTDGDGWQESMIAVLLIVVVAVLMLLGKTVPEWLVGIMGMIAGFFFGAKVERHTSE